MHYVTNFGPVSESPHVHWRHSCPTILSLVDSTEDDRLTLSELVFFALMGLLLLLFVFFFFTVVSYVCRLLIWNLFV